MTSTRRQQRLVGQLIHQYPPADVPLYLSHTKVATITGLTSFKPTHPRYPILEFSRPSLVVYSSMFRRLSSNIKMIPLEKLFLFASSFLFFFVAKFTAMHKASLSFSPNLSFSHELAKLNTLIHLCRGLWKNHSYQWRRSRSACAPSKRPVVRQSDGIYAKCSWAGFTLPGGGANRAWKTRQVLRYQPAWSFSERCFER